MSPRVEKIDRIFQSSKFTTNLQQEMSIKTDWNLAKVFLVQSGTFFPDVGAIQILGYFKPNRPS